MFAPPHGGRCCFTFSTIAYNVIKIVFDINKMMLYPGYTCMPLLKIIMAFKQYNITSIIIQASFIFCCFYIKTFFNRKYCWFFYPIDHAY